jgi:hypothetical protein
MGSEQINAAMLYFISPLPRTRRKQVASAPGIWSQNFAHRGAEEGIFAAKQNCARAA